MHSSARPRGRGASPGRVACGCSRGDARVPLPSIPALPSSRAPALLPPLPSAPAGPGCCLSLKRTRGPLLAVLHAPRLTNERTQLRPGHLFQRLRARACGIMGLGQGRKMVDSWSFSETTPAALTTCLPWHGQGGSPACTRRQSHMPAGECPGTRACRSAPRCGTPGTGTTASRAPAGTCRRRTLRARGDDDDGRRGRRNAHVPAPFSPQPMASTHTHVDSAWRTA